MMRYRKKPIVIEAFRPTEVDDVQSVPHWWLDALAKDWRTHGAVLADDPGCGGGFSIWTLEGQMHVDKGDWVIRGVKGEIYPCKPDIFAATYEAVE